MRATVCVFLLQLGAPVDIAAIEPFLRNLLEDVLPVPSWLRRFVARRIAMRTSRSHNSSKPMPAAAAALGVSEWLVNPGIVLASRT